MIGEIRDTETAQIAIQSALTGHLVFTTVHANNVIDVIGRFLNMGVEPYNFVSSLNCVPGTTSGTRDSALLAKRPHSYSEEELMQAGSAQRRSRSGFLRCLWVSTAISRVIRSYSNS